MYPRVVSWLSNGGVEKLSFAFEDRREGVALDTYFRNHGAKYPLPVFFPYSNWRTHLETLTYLSEW